jgi:hypothetical protein
LRGAFFKKKKAMRYYGRPKDIYVRAEYLSMGLRLIMDFGVTSCYAIPISLMNGW